LTKRARASFICLQSPSFGAGHQRAFIDSFTGKSSPLSEAFSFLLQTRESAPFARERRQYFLGMVEAPLLIRPYLRRMCGKLFITMTCGWPISPGR
jgi:hypothetical protein